jgi:hypothetical protein
MSARLRLEFLALIYFQVPGNGDCLFQALLQSMNRAGLGNEEAPYTATHLRRQILATLIIHR